MIKRKIFKYRLQSLLICLLWLLPVVNIFAQQGQQTVKGTQISDGTVFTNTLNPLDFSILDLSSAERGFILPRLTTEERSAIPIGDIEPGLMVFNTTIDCVEFFSATRQLWLSLCGDENEPAEVEITNSGCQSIIISGNYAEKVFLQPRANTINLQVSVSVAGSYQIEAEAFQMGSTKSNGYSFYASGVFPSAGIYNVVLKGSGTPEKGYPRDANGLPLVAGDQIRFVLNGVKSTCMANNFVDQVGLKYDFTIKQSNQKIYKGDDITLREDLLTAELTNITSAGKVEVTALLENGIMFKGSRYLTENEIVTKKASLKLIAHGKASIAMTTPMNFKSNSFVDFGIGEKQKIVKQDVRVELVNIDGLCNNPYYGFKVNGDWEVNKPFTSNHSIELPIRVTAPGRGVFKIRTGDVVFSSNNVDLNFNTQSDNMMYVILRPETNTPSPKVIGQQKLIVTFESNSGADYDNIYPVEKVTKVLDCPEYVVNIKGKAEFNFSGSTLKFWSHFISKTNSKMYLPPKSDMSIGSNGIRSGLTLRINITTPGEYDFKTQEINGIKFVAKGIAEKTGIQDIVLKPEGKSISDMPTQTYILFMDGQATNLNAKVDFVYESMKIYSIGNEGWHPGGLTNIWGGGPNLIRSTANFGWDGIVRIDNLEILLVSGNGYVNTDNHISDNRMAATFKTNLDNADIVVIGARSALGNITKSSSQMSDLRDFVRNKKGALIYGEGISNHMIDFMNSLGTGAGSATNVSGAQHNQANRIVSYLSEKNKKILGESYTYFGAAYGGLPLSNKLIGGQGTGTEFLLNGLPSSYEVLAYANGTTSGRNNVFAFVHNNYGFVGVNSSTFMGGHNSATSSGSNNYPTASYLGRPRNASFSGGDVYNAWLLLNLMHWSIDYAQEQRTSRY
jgi:hypothetical protein